LKKLNLNLNSLINQNIFIFDSLICIFIFVKKKYVSLIFIYLGQSILTHKNSPKLNKWRIHV